MFTKAASIFENMFYKNPYDTYIMNFCQNTFSNSRIAFPIYKLSGSLDAIKYEVHFERYKYGNFLWLE